VFQSSKYFIWQARSLGTIPNLDEFDELVVVFAGALLSKSVVGLENIQHPLVIWKQLVGQLPIVVIDGWLRSYSPLHS
jgi:hypothetical protein